MTYKRMIYRHSGTISGIAISIAVPLVCWLYLNLNEGLLYFITGLSTIPILLFVDDFVMQQQRNNLSKMDKEIEQKIGEIYDLL